MGFNLGFKGLMRGKKWTLKYFLHFRAPDDERCAARNMLSF